MAKVLASKMSKGTPLNELVGEIISIQMTANQNGVPASKFEGETAPIRIATQRFDGSAWISEGTTLCFYGFLKNLLLTSPAGHEPTGRLERIEDDPVGGEARSHFELVEDEEVHAALTVS